MASTIKITVRRQAKADGLLVQGVIIVDKTGPIDRYYDIALDILCPICAKGSHIMLRYPNLEQACCYLGAGLHLTNDHKCDFHRCGSKKGKICNHTIAQCCNCDGKDFASASTYQKRELSIETTKTGRAKLWEMKRVAQQEGIYIEVEDKAEAVAMEAESTPEAIDLLAEVNATIMELTVDEDVTHEQMDSGVLEYWEDTDV